MILCSLVACNVSQVLFIFIQLPFRERYENFNQGVTNGCQAAFFLVMAITKAGDQADGSALSMINQVGMAVVILNSCKAQAIMIKVAMVKARQRFNLLTKQTKEFCNDPCGFAGCDHKDNDAWCLEDDLWLQGYLITPGSLEAPDAWEDTIIGAAAAEIQEKAEAMLAQQGPTSTSEPMPASCIEALVLGVLRRVTFGEEAHPSDALGSDGYSQDGILQEAAFRYARDWLVVNRVQACLGVEKPDRELQIKNANCQAFGTACVSEDDVKPPHSDTKASPVGIVPEEKPRSMGEKAGLVARAKLIVFRQKLNKAIAMRAVIACYHAQHDEGGSTGEEEYTTEVWPPTSHFQLSAWRQACNLEPDQLAEMVEDCAYATAAIDTFAKAEAVLLLSPLEDDHRRERLHEVRRPSEGASFIDAAAEAIGEQVDALLEGEGEFDIDDENAETLYKVDKADASKETTEGKQTLKMLKVAYRQREAQKAADEEECEKREAEIAQAYSLLSENLLDLCLQPSDQADVDLAAIVATAEVTAAIDTAFLAHATELCLSLSGALLEGQMSYPPRENLQSLPEDLLRCSRDMITDSFDEVAPGLTEMTVNDEFDRKEHFGRQVLSAMKKASITVFQTWGMHSDAAYRRAWQATASYTEIEKFVDDVLHKRHTSEELSMATTTANGDLLAELVSLADHPANATLSKTDCQQLRQVLHDHFLAGFGSRLPPKYQTGDAEAGPESNEIALLALAGKLSHTVFEKVLQKVNRDATQMVSHVIHLTTWTLAVQYRLTPAGGLWREVTPSQALAAIEVIEVALRQHLALSPGKGLAGNQFRGELRKALFPALGEERSDEVTLFVEKVANTGVLAFFTTQDKKADKDDQPLPNTAAVDVAADSSDSHTVLVDAAAVVIDAAAVVIEMRSCLGNRPPPRGRETVISSLGSLAALEPPPRRTSNCEFYVGFCGGARGESGSEPLYPKIG